jgi:hypothetical protein
LPNFGWYYGPPAIVLALFQWMALQAAVRFGANVIRWHGTLVAPAVSWTIAIIMLVVVLVGTPHYTTSQPGNRTHVLAARWLRQHAARGDTIVAYEIGTIAHLSGLRTVDLLGLTDPGARAHLREGDFAWAIRDLPTYVFSNERSAWLVTDAIFKECAFVLNYRPAVHLPFREYTDYVIYRRAHLDDSDASGGPWAAEWLDVYHPTSMRSGLTAAYSMTIRNSSTSPWRAHTPDAPLVTYEWRDEHGRHVESEALQTPLPCDIGPGQRVLLSASVRSPKQAGTYMLNWRLFREGIGYFSEHGMPTAAAPVVVY